MNFIFMYEIRSHVDVCLCEIFYRSFFQFDNLIQNICLVIFDVIEFRNSSIPIDLCQYRFVFGIECIYSPCISRSMGFQELFPNGDSFLTPSFFKYYESINTNTKTSSSRLILTASFPEQHDEMFLISFQNLRESFDVIIFIHIKSVIFNFSPLLLR